MKITQTASLMLLCGVASAMLMGQANALEARAFIDQVATVYKAVGYDLQFGPATLDGDTVVVDGVTVGLVDAIDGFEPMTFETEIVFTGVAEAADGGYTAQSVTVPDIDADFAADPVGHITLSDIAIESLFIPGGETVPAAAALQLVRSISTGALSLTRDGVEVLAMDSMEAGSTFSPSQGSAALTDISSSLAIRGIALNLATLSEEDPAAGAMLAALGLTEVSGDITQDMSWSMADGRMAINAFLFDFADVGALDISGEVLGLTPAVLGQIQAMQSAMADGGEATAEQQQAQMMSGMAIMQGVSIVGASVRYDDASLAGSLLDTFAEQSGADRASFVAGLKAALPGLMAQSGIPALNDLAVPAVSEFLDNPESLEVSVAPASPTSILVLMAAAANPASLITALGLTIQANQAIE